MAQGQCPQQCLHPLSSAYVLGPFPISRILHCIHIPLPAIPQTHLPWLPLFRAGVPLAKWATLGLLGALMPTCHTLGVQLEREVPQVAPWQPGPAVPWYWSTVGMGTLGPSAPSVGVWVGWAPQIPVIPVSESGWDG